VVVRVSKLWFEGIRCGPSCMGLEGDRSAPWLCCLTGTTDRQLEICLFRNHPVSNGMAGSLLQVSGGQVSPVWCALQSSRGAGVVWCHVGSGRGFGRRAALRDPVELLQVREQVSLKDSLHNPSASSGTWPCGQCGALACSWSQDLAPALAKE
jgi:hypothetical protein